MTRPNDALTQLIRDEIERDGPIPFARFMELALYHPSHGYYSSGRCAIGRRGDYFTSVSVGPLFGRMLAAQFAEIWEILGRPNDFAIVEQGAHDGAFAGDVLAALQASEPECFAAVRYRIVEPFTVLRRRQEEALGAFAEKINWLAEVEPFTGVFFANELLDASPVHLLVKDDEPWKERFVELGLEGRAPSRPRIRNTDDTEVVPPVFAFIERPVTDERLLTRLAKTPFLPNERYETEVNLANFAWLDAIAPKLLRGVILLADYGFTRADYYAPARTGGTLQAYAEHRVLPSPLDYPGACDLTAHVEWTSLAECAEELGLTITGFTDQHHFLTGLLARDPALVAAKNPRTLQTLLHPEILGTKFQFLALTKDFSGSLGGFEFARDPRRTLGL